MPYAPTLIERFESRRLERDDECWLWTGGRNRDGYGRFCVDGRRGSSRYVKAHRFAWEQVHGEIPDGLCVLHRCDVPACVNPDHLFLGTRIENNADRDAKRRQVAPDHRGEKHPLARLTEEHVRQIRERVRAGERQRVVAAHFGVDASAISRIVSGGAWSHVPI